ncbi:MAG: DMT family transporter [Ancalomicrobiaceae bacterium]|nr:DMT family transporter [Ancalomicrobiaceae bacterium]
MPIVPPRHPALDERAVRKGIAIMLSGLLLFAVMNAMVKQLAAAFPVNQIVFFRGALGLVPLAVLMAVLGVRPQPRVGRIALNLPHVAAMTGTLLLAYVAFATLPLGEVTAIFFLQPVLVAVLSALVLRETVSLKVWAAVGIGFLGVLLIARPSGISTDIGLVYALSAAGLSSITMLQQRHLAVRLDPLEVVFWFMMLSALALLPSLFVWWAAPTAEQWLLLAVMGVVSGVGQFLLILPLKFAPASRLAPIYYTNLIGGIVGGYLCFDEVPDTPMLVGCGIVAVSTALVLTAGQSRTARSDPAAVPPAQPQPTLAPSLSPTPALSAAAVLAASPELFASPALSPAVTSETPHHRRSE